MKKISLKNANKSLSRDEMRLISGGGDGLPPGCYDCGDGCVYRTGIIRGCGNGSWPSTCGTYNSISETCEPFWW
jgi:natural product precursor